MNSVYDKNISNHSICHALQKYFHLFTIYCYFIYSSQDDLEHWR